MTVGGHLDRWLRDVVRGSERASTFDWDSYLVRVHISLTTTLEPGVVATPQFGTQTFTASSHL